MLRSSACAGCGPTPLGSRAACGSGPGSTCCSASDGAARAPSRAHNQQQLLCRAQVPTECSRTIPLDTAEHYCRAHARGYFRQRLASRQDAHTAGTWQAGYGVERSCTTTQSNQAEATLQEIRGEASWWAGKAISKGTKCMLHTYRQQWSSVGVTGQHRRSWRCNGREALLQNCPPWTLL